MPSYTKADLDRSGLGDQRAVTDHVRSLGYRVVATGW
jgi:hypothetical protein